MNLLQAKELELLHESAEQTESQQEIERFAVDSLDKANWAFKKISALNARIGEKEELAESEIERVKSWLESESKADKESIEYFEALLVNYYKRLRADDPKAKLSTPYGKVTSRKKQPSWEFDDLETLKYFKTNHPELIEVKESFNKTQAKKVFNPILNELGSVVDENGEVVEFVKAVPQGDSFSVKAD